jgi:hypothetical protein
MYINGKENAKLTGDRMKMLMMALPFMVRDLIAPEVFSRDIPRYPKISFYMICISLFKCRLSSSILAPMLHQAALHCTAFPTFLTQVMALWRCYPFKMPEHTFRGTNPQAKNRINWDILFCEFHIRVLFRKG